MAILFLMTLLSVYAQTPNELDQKLQEYVKTFALKPLSPLPAKNEALFQLGKELFMEQQLSGNNNISCMDCHHPSVGTGDGLVLGLGEGAEGLELKAGSRLQKSGIMLARNTPPLFNLGGLEIPYFWDGRVRFAPNNKIFITPDPDLNGASPVRSDITSVMKSGLAAQAIFPMVNHAEMRGRPGTNAIADAKTNSEAWDLITEKILKIEHYKKMFDKVFPGEKINIGHFGEAIAHFERHQFYFGDTPYDRYLKGDVYALSLKEKQGMELFFNKAGCGNCHNGEYLANFGFFNIALPQIGPGVQDGEDFGRFQWNPNEFQRWAFRTTPLRNVVATAPYMHNGIFKNLEEVIHHYNDVEAGLKAYGQFTTPLNYADKIKDHDHKDDDKRISVMMGPLNRKLNLTEEEKQLLIHFLERSLTDQNFTKKD